jgi:hypothetical protein
MTRREIRHQLALMEQDREFIRNAHIRQKIYAGIFTVFILAFWAWLIKYDPVNWWYGFVIVPLAFFGLWLMVTKTNYPWEIMQEEKKYGRNKRFI